MAPRRAGSAPPYVPAIPETCRSSYDVSSFLSFLLPVAGVSARPARVEDGRRSRSGAPVGGPPGPQLTR